jgi:hypothetical protein
VLLRHGIDPANAHLGIKLAAQASGRDPTPLLVALRQACARDAVL